ncbi:copper resistance protein CopC [Dactylosporangium sp. NPDC051484]|uniref:copper resistance CopC/CopD family protein n=1 Tax=Dactylosporangium sp. NPDC051484 TaxID=3154942 RepID=UPI00344C296E
MIVLAVMGIVLWPAPAWAHATLVSTTPTDGGHLDSGPALVAFTLSEAVSVVAGSPQVVDQDGRRYEIARAELSADRTVVTVWLARALPDGSFLATARLLSVDTHVVSVSAAFTVGAADGLITAHRTEATGIGDRIVSYAAKLLTYLGAVSSAGVLVTTACLWPHLRERRRWQLVVRWGGILLVAGLTSRLVVDAVHRSGGFTRISSGALDVTGGFGLSALIALGALLLHLNLPRSRLVGVGAAVATVLAVTYGGHGADPALFPLPLALTALHVYAILAWLGGVVVIAVELHRDVPLATWHRYALAHVALAAGTGAGLGLLRVPAPEALLTTAYGKALMVKVALVAMALATAAVVYRRLARPGGVRLVGAELLLATTVFGATGVLSSVAPASASYDPPVHTTVNFGGGAVLDISIPSTRRGPQQLIVESARESALSVDLSSEAANVARLPVRFDAAQRTGRGVRWSSRDLVVPVRGNWQVTVTFTTPAGPRVASFRYDVR